MNPAHPSGKTKSGRYDSGERRERKSTESIVSRCITILKGLPEGARLSNDPQVTDVEAMLLSYKRYTTPHKLARRLFSSLRNAVKLLDIPQVIGALRLLELWLRMRIDARFLHTLEDLTPTMSRLSLIKEAAVRNELNRVKLALLWSHSVPRYAACIPQSDSLPAASASNSTRLWAHTSDMIAEALTQVEYAYFCAIPAMDFNDKAWSKPDRAARLRDFIERSNSTSDWVASNILVQTTPAAQLKVFCKFIWIAQRCHKLGNHSSCAAIFAGCSKNCISRLYRVWKTPDKEYRLLFSLIKGIVSPEKNYARYRSMLQTQVATPDAAFIPHVAVLLRDLTFVEDANADYLTDGTPNWEKINMLRSVLAIIHRARTTPFKKLRTAPPQLTSLVERLPRRGEEYLDKRSFDIRPRGDGSLTDISSEYSQLELSASNSSGADTDAETHSTNSSGDEGLAEVESDMGASVSSARRK